MQHVEECKVLPKIDINSPALQVNDMILMDHISPETPLQLSSHSKAIDTSIMKPDWNW